VEVSVIIPLLDSPIVGQTISALQSQAAQATGLEIIVVGRDGFAQVQPGPGLSFIDTGRQVSPATARNQGAGRARGRFLLFLDSDAVPTPGWIDGLLHHLRADRPIVGGAVDFPRSNYWAWSDNVSAFHEFSPTAPHGERRYLPTIGLGMTRAAFEKIGPFDESYACAEDMDLTLRAYCAGYTLYFEPSAVLLHYPSRTDLAAILKRRFQAGREMVFVRSKFHHVLHTPFFLRRRFPLLFLSPLLALAAAMRPYLRGHSPWQHLPTFPAVYLTKLAWCTGAFLRLTERDLHGQEW
jgi:GT2 family glycosyltransferase